MQVQKLRLDTVAMNLANTNTTRTSAGGPYQPLEVVVKQSFESYLSSEESQFKRLEAEVIEKASEPKLVYQPEHPDADETGMVTYPSINSTSEMVAMMDSTRAYEANVKALNAAKTMALKALEIGE